MSDIYQWFDPFQTRETLFYEMERSDSIQREAEYRIEGLERERKYLQGRCEGMMDFAAKIAAAMPVQPLTIRVSQ